MVSREVQPNAFRGFFASGASNFVNARACVDSGSIEPATSEGALGFRFNSTQAIPHPSLAFGRNQIKSFSCVSYY